MHEPHPFPKYFLVYQQLLQVSFLVHLKEKIPDIEERKDHIIKNMIYMAELRSENTEKLKNLFGLRIFF